MPSTDRTHLAFAIARRVASISCIALAIYLIWCALPSAYNRKYDSTFDVILAILFIFLFIGMFAFRLLWLPLRLWARWNASTIRWCVGIVLGAGILYLATFISVHLGLPVTDPRREAIVFAILLPLLILGDGQDLATAMAVESHGRS